MHGQTYIKLSNSEFHEYPTDSGLVADVGSETYGCHIRPFPFCQIYEIMAVNWVRGALAV
jgi:hypothetical protein